MRKPRLRRLLGCWQVTEWEVIEPRFQPSQTDSKPIYSLKKSILLAVKVQIVPSATGSQMPRRADSQERGGQWRDQERLLALIHASSIPNCQPCFSLIASLELAGLK